MHQPNDPFQTLTMLRTALSEAGLSPRKLFGQHFMIDRNLMMKLIDAAELSPTDVALEVGAGAGSLTGLLAQRAGRVVAVEIDRKLAEIARENLAGFDNVRLVVGDALARKSQVAPEVIAAVNEVRDEAGGGDIKLVANLPYDIATALVIDLLLGDPPLSRLCFTVQDEVARRFLAEADTDDYGPVSIVTAMLARGRRVAKAPPRVFWPEPKVDSAIVRLDVPGPAGERLAGEDRGRFAAFVRHFFLHRRKTMGHSARQSPWGQAALQAMIDMGLDVKIRPGEISPELWLDLFRRAT